MSEEGIATDPKKVEKICNLSATKDKDFETITSTSLKATV